MTVSDDFTRFQRLLYLRWAFAWAQFCCGAFLLGSLTLAGCGKPGNSSTNTTNAFVMVTSVNENAPLQSDVLTNGYAKDDTVKVKFKSQRRQLGSGDTNPTDPDGVSPFDTIMLQQYVVNYQRSDGGPNPSAFTGGLNITLAPDAEAEASIVVVRAFDKHRSPLEELRDDGEIFTSAVITFYGEDGYGNDLAVSGSLSISFANFTDS